MLVSEFITDAIYRWINQKLPSYLMGPSGITKAINFALNDIFSYEGKYWTFMYTSEEVDTTLLTDTGDVTLEATLTYPIQRIVRIDDMSSTALDKFENVNTEPFDGVRDLEINEFRYHPHTTRLKIYNNKSKYKIHYIHYFPVVGYDDVIPLPDLFLGVLYNLTLSYIYPQYWQIGDNRETNVYNKARQQLTDLAKTDSLQLYWVEGNIH